MDKTPDTSPPRYERDGHSLTVENHFAGERTLKEVIKAYLSAVREEETP